MKISTLKKQFFQTWLIKAIEFLRVFYLFKFIMGKELKHFSYDFKKPINLGKLYLLPKAHKYLYNVPGRPIISNCGNTTDKACEFLDFPLKPLMQKGWSYI